MTDHGTVAQRALDEVAGIPPDRVAVLGDGELADLLRRELATSAAPDAETPPLAIIDAAGAADGIAWAIETVAPGGTVVLAVDPEQPIVDVRTYADIHVRGLTVVGIPPD